MVRKVAQGIKCGDCSKTIEKKDLGVECEICSYWFHSYCQSMSEEKFNFIANDNSIHWFCNRCDVSASKTMKLMSVLLERQDATDKKMGVMEQKVDALSASVGNVEHQIPRIAKVEESVHGVGLGVQRIASDMGKMKDALKSELTSELATLQEHRGHSFDITQIDAAELRKLVRQEAYEVEERRKRVNSIVIRGLGNNSEEIKNEMATISTNIAGKSIDVTDIVTLQQDLVRAKIENVGDKKLLLENAKQLKDRENRKYEHVYISRDLTKTQREELVKRRQNYRNENGAAQAPRDYNRHRPTARDQPAFHTRLLHQRPHYEDHSTKQSTRHDVGQATKPRYHQATMPLRLPHTPQQTPQRAWSNTAPIARTMWRQPHFQNTPMKHQTQIMQSQPLNQSAITPDRSPLNNTLPGTTSQSLPKIYRMPTPTPSTLPPAGNGIQHSDNIQPNGMVVPVYNRAMPNSPFSNV